MRMKELFVGKNSNGSAKFKVMLVTPSHPEFKFGFCNLWEEIKVEEEDKELFFHYEFSLGFVSIFF